MRPFRASLDGLPETTRVADELRAFLPQSYQLKAIADYETGPGSHISEQTARAALTTARRFIECVTSLIDIAP